MNNRPTNNLPLVLAILGALFLGMLIVVAHNDKGSATEVALLNGTPVQATDSECDAMYHAIWKVKSEPSHSTLVGLALDMGCPMEDK